MSKCLTFLAGLEAAAAAVAEEKEEEAVTGCADNASVFALL
jgi:hypothetical protein